MTSRVGQGQGGLMVTRGAAWDGHNDAEGEADSEAHAGRPTFPCSPPYQQCAASGLGVEMTVALLQGSDQTTEDKQKKG